MSPASRSKPKDKKIVKDAQKASSKASGPATSGNIPASAYNPLLGTFHNLEVAPISANLSLQSNGRFRNIDETDEHGGASIGAGVDYDSVSNNGSWSGESEDHKEKTCSQSRVEPIPGADNDKREKIRQKNERKHQRQKERRAQELHERCSGYLMSRKLESLAQQLVTMGFSHERATMALILNEGRVEESVAWLFEGGEEADKHRSENLRSSNLKIDISEELARIAEMETKFKCSKQEVQRAVVACEGDLEKAEETLRMQKKDSPSVSSKTEETGYPPSISNGKNMSGANEISVRLQSGTSQSPIIQQKTEDRDFNYTKATVGGGLAESGIKNMEPLKKAQPKLEWAKPQQSAIQIEKGWPNTGSNTSVSCSLPSHLQTSPQPAKMEPRFIAAGGEFKKTQPGSVREPIIMMHRPQSVNLKQAQATVINSSASAAVASWSPTTSVEIMKSTGLPHMSSSQGLSTNNLRFNQVPVNYQHQHYIPGSGPGDFVGSGRSVSSWSRSGASPTLAAASSLGLFSRLGSSSSSSGSSSPVDWNTGGSVAHLDYSCIDWSLDLSSRKPSGFLFGLASFMKDGEMYNLNSPGLGSKPSTRPSASPGNGVPLVGFQDGGMATKEMSTAGVWEWTSPFEARDLFSLPRQFVSSPSL